MGKRYRPANGSEGDGFIHRFCSGCERDRLFRESQGLKQGCEILARTMVFDVTDAQYPDEWTYDDDGRPTCTAWVPEASRRNGKETR